MGLVHRERDVYSRRARGDTGEGFAWQQKSDILPEDKTAEFKQYPMVTAVDLRGKRRRPKRTKMLMRDFIEGARNSNVAVLLLC